MICSNECRFYTLKCNAHSRHELHYYNELQPKNTYYYINIMMIDLPNGSCHTTSLQQQPWTMNLVHIITMMFDLPNIGVALHWCNNAHSRYISTIKN
jgi:hypothetical protein